MFNIKLKTKSGNDINKKETITVFFRVRIVRNALTNKNKAEYVYRIVHSNGVVDSEQVYSIKDSNSIKSKEDLILKVMLNMCHYIALISKKYNFNPDFVVFISTDFNAKRSKAWQYLKDIFSRDPVLWEAFDLNWDDSICQSFKIDKENLDQLKQFVELNPNAKFMNIDPNHNKEKYEGSLKICDKLYRILHGKEEAKEEHDWW